MCIVHIITPIKMWRVCYCYFFSYLTGSETSLWPGLLKRAGFTSMLLAEHLLSSYIKLPKPIIPSPPPLPLTCPDIEIKDLSSSLVCLSLTFPFHPYPLFLLPPTSLTPYAHAKANKQKTRKSSSCWDGRSEGYCKDWRKRSDIKMPSYLKSLNLRWHSQRRFNSMVKFSEIA